MRASTLSRALRACAWAGLGALVWANREEINDAFTEWSESWLSEPV